MSRLSLRSCGASLSLVVLALSAAVVTTDSSLAASSPAAGAGVPTLPNPPSKPGTEQYNEWLGRSFNGVLQNQKDPAKAQTILKRIVSPGYIQHNPLAPPGRDGVGLFLTAIGQSLPDSHTTIRDVVATRTNVVTRWTFKGTLTGAPFLGIPASGQKVEFNAIDIWTVKNGKLYEHWDSLDWARAIAQLTPDGKLPQVFIDNSKKPVDK